MLYTTDPDTRIAAETRFGVTAAESATRHRLRRHRGAAAVLAMMFLVLMTTLAVSMYMLAATNVQSASNLSDVQQAQSAAESGLHWMQYRFVRMNRPKTTVGNITATVANSLWPSLKTAIVSDFNTLLTTTERPTTATAKTITSSAISIDESGAKFSVTIQQHPIDAGDVLDQRYIRVTSTGKYRCATRSASLDFKIDKKVKFAVVGKVPIQIGRNTITEGPVGMATTGKYPPIYMLSDFAHFNSTLTTKINNFNAWLEAHHTGYDGRVASTNTTEWNAAKAAGYTDYNNDSFIDDYDLFMKQFDSNGDRSITKAEFTNPSTGKLYEANLFAAIDALNGPLFTGDVARAGFQDNKIDANDGYSKIRGQILLATKASDWTANLVGSGLSIYDQITGAIVPTDGSSVPVKFEATTTDIFDLTPSNFQGCTDNYKTMTGPAAGTTKRTATAIENTVLTAADANGGTVNEKTPYGSTSYQATYKRPVFKNITFKNVQIPKGMNALFENCTFQGVTYVDMERDITTSTGAVTTSQTSGSTWSQKMLNGTTFANTTVLTPTINQAAQKGNNIRYNNCTFNGPLIGAYSTAYTHFGNSWEFTGATLFDNKVDQTATIVCPNTNIEMGSFTDPSAAPSKLVGVVVAGNIDIRGTSTVDGSIIVTGDGAGNTTLGYFGTSDSDTNPTALPEGGYGRLNIRYNPYRALPDGINVAIDVLPDVDSYREGM